MQVDTMQVEVATRTAAPEKVWGRRREFWGSNPFGENRPPHDW